MFRSNYNTVYSINTSRINHVVYNHPLSPTNTLKKLYKTGAYMHNLSSKSTAKTTEQTPTYTCTKCTLKRVTKVANEVPFANIIGRKLLTTCHSNDQVVAHLEQDPCEYGSHGRYHRLCCLAQVDYRSSTASDRTPSVGRPDHQSESARRQ
jgi:hypothetical protein